MDSLFPGLSSCCEAASHFSLGFNRFHLAESFDCQSQIHAKLRIEAIDGHSVVQEARKGDAFTIMIERLSSDQSLQGVQSLAIVTLSESGTTALLEIFKLLLLSVRRSEWAYGSDRYR